jgi:LPS export ABC transporter permease LptG
VAAHLLAPVPPLSRDLLLRLLIPLGLALAGLLLFSWLVPQEKQAVAAQLVGFPDSDVTAHLVRPAILGVLCFLPAVGGIGYALSGTIARYLARQFLVIFAICFAALFAIWLLVDLQNNLGDMRGSKHLLVTMGVFYGTRLPSILLLLLPYALLLSLLYALGKLSKSREILAMIQTGRALPQVAAPLIAAGLFSTVLCAGLNYHWAPVAEGTGEEILQRAKGAPVTEANDVLYRNAEKRRLWMIGSFPPDYEKGAALRNVEVTTSADNGTLVSRLSAKEATWNRQTRVWTFGEATAATFARDMPPVFETTGSVTESGWSETPWQLIKPGLSAPFLGIPDLNSWLQTNAGNETMFSPAPYLTQWHYRWAQPAICLVTVLLAAPLGIHFSRRGSTGGVAVAVLLCGGLMFLTNISLSLGEAGYLPPALAAWLPNLVFALIGLYLFHRRIAGRPIYQTLRRVFHDE